MSLIGEIRKQETESLSAGMVTFGVYLKDIRKSVGATQLMLAEELGYTSPQFISNYERGLCYPALITIPKICNILGLELEPVINMYCSCKKMDYREDLGLGA